MSFALHSRSRFGRSAANAASDRETVLMSWPSVPVELVRAAGLSPVFARGRSTPTPAADRVLEPDLFPNRLRQLVEAALTNRLADVAAIVLPRSSDPDYKCFLYLRELVRRGIAANLPPILLFDLLQSDDSDARAYNSRPSARLVRAPREPCGSAASSGEPAQCDSERQSRTRCGQAPPRPAKRSTAHRRGRRVAVARRVLAARARALCRASECDSRHTSPTSAARTPACARSRRTRRCANHACCDRSRGRRRRRGAEPVRRLRH